MDQLHDEDRRRSGAVSKNGLRLINIDDENVAIGAAAQLMLTHPAFSDGNFGEWIKILQGQAKRRHQIFVVDDRHRVLGYFGYTITSEDLADRWLSGGAIPLDGGSASDDAVIFNVWISESKDASLLLIHAFRLLARRKKAVFFRRFYKDGRVKTFKVPIGEAVERHIRDFHQE